MNLLLACLLCLHLLAAAFWVGGMAVFHWAVRPAALATLAPPLRLPFMAAALERFLNGVSGAIVLLLVTGFGLIGMVGGMRHVHWSVHAMLTLGLVMMALFGHLRFAVFARLKRHVAASDWPAAAAQLDTLRRLVGVNLGLGVVVFAVALIGRAL